MTRDGAEIHIQGTKLSCCGGNHKNNRVKGTHLDKTEIIEENRFQEAKGEKIGTEVCCYW